MGNGRDRRARPGGQQKVWQRAVDKELLAATRAALDDGHPLALLQIASTAVSISAAPPEERGDVPDLPTFIDLLGKAPQVEAAALLAAVDGLCDLPPATRNRISRAIAVRRRDLPRWLRGDLAAEVEGVRRLVEPLGDIEDVAIGLRLPDGAAITAIAVLDHNLGGSLVDGLAVGLDLADVVARFADVEDRHAPRVLDADPADERARVEDALRSADEHLEPIESESWPATRPLLEWAVRQLPEGGEPPSFDDPDPDEIARMVDAVLATPDGRRLGEEGRDQVATLLETAAGYAGDPLRWSPTTVEIQLGDVLPRTLGAATAVAEGMPDAMAAVIRWAHAERGIAPALTEETLAAVQQHGRAFRRGLR